MKYSLSHLLLVVALIGMGIAWGIDHVRLSRANEKLNAEAAELLDRWSMQHQSNGLSALDFPNGEIPPTRVYDFTKPEDRDAYREIYGHSGVTALTPTGQTTDESQTQHDRHEATKTASDDATLGDEIDVELVHDQEKDD